MESTLQQNDEIDRKLLEEILSEAMGNEWKN
jgi:hypothetical protein